jgi:hypothetical protein
MAFTPFAPVDTMIIVPGRGRMIKQDRDHPSRGDACIDTWTEVSSNPRECLPEHV